MIVNSKRNVIQFAGLAANRSASLLFVRFLFVCVFLGGMGEGPFSLAVGEDFSFSHLTVADGLSDSAMTSVVQDHQGFMWFGTKLGGLNRYDGYEFKVYQHDENDARSLSLNNVTTLFLDRQGTLWVGTRGSGLCRYNRDTDDFTRYCAVPGDAASLADNMVNAICEDASGALWVGTCNGLCRLDRKTDTFVAYRYDPDILDSLSDNFIRSLFFDPQTGRLWVGTLRGGIRVLEQKSDDFTAYQHNPNVPESLSSNQILCFFKDRFGTLWIGTDAGLNRFVPETETFASYRHDPGDPNSLGYDYVWSLYEDRAGRFWVCTSQVLQLMDRRRGSFTTLAVDPGNSKSLNSGSITMIYEDRMRAIWALSNEEGINYMAGQTDRFTIYRHNPNRSNSLTHNFVRSVFVDSVDRVWIGTEHGFDCLEHGQFTHYLKGPASPPVHSFAEDADGQIWAGMGASQGLLCIQDAVRYRHNPQDPNSPASDNVWTMIADERGGLWIAYWAACVDYFDGKTFTHYWPDPANPKTNLPSNLVYSCAQDQNGFIWFAAWGGLSRLDPKTNTVTTFQADPKPSGEIIQAFVAVFVERHDSGNVWVGASEGLFQFDSISEQFVRRYTKRDGLPSDSIETIRQDNQGCLWLGTVTGLSRFDPKMGTFRNYDISDGLPSNKFFKGAASKTSDGRMFFGTTDGLVAFHPDKMEDNPHPPPIVLTGFELFNKPVSIGRELSPLKQAINVTDEITLTHQQSMFTFKFAALNYTSPEKNQYAYKMEGFDKDWRYTDAKRRYATYTRLAPGTYTFRVRAANNDGVWNNEGTSLAVTILPPWWGTWWFRVLLLVTIGASILTVHKNRTRQMKKRNLQLAAQVRERTAQLEEANKELEAFSYSVSHDLRAPLRSIDGFSNLLLKRYLSELDAKGEEYLYRISNATQRMGRLIDDLLNLSRISRTEMKLKPVNLSEIVHILADELNKTDPERGVKWEIADNTTAQGDPALLRIVLENLVGNAWKFTMKKKNAQIEFGLEKQDSLEVYYIRDNGAGFDMKYADKLFGAFQRLHVSSEYPGTGIGLVICKRIITRHGGQIWARAAVNKGATFYFTLP